MWMMHSLTSRVLATPTQDNEKKKEAESMLGPLTDDKFHQLLSLSKKITDYSADRDAVGMNVDR